MPIGYSHRMVGAADAEMRLDPVEHDAEEDVVPAIAVMHRHAGERATALSASPIVANRSTPAWRSNASATVSRSGAAAGSQTLSSQRSSVAPVERQQRGAVVHDRLVAGAGAIPFEHGELGMMQRRALGVAEHAGELEEPRHAAGQQLLHRELGRAVQPARARRGRRASSSRWRSPRDAPRRPAPPAGSASRPRRSPVGEPVAHRRLESAPAPADRAGGGRACRGAIRSCRTIARAALRRVGSRA